MRTPTPADADDLGRVHVRAWQAAYRGGLMPDEYLDALSESARATMWRQSLENEPRPRPRSSRLVAEADGGAVIGFIVVGPAGTDPDAEIGEVYAINVEPEHWGTGVGHDLLEAGMAALVVHGYAHAILWVHPDNARACRFYEARGWVDDDVERRQEVLGVDVAETRYSRPLA